jgi:hypothetical protein
MIRTERVAKLEKILKFSARDAPFVFAAAWGASVVRLTVESLALPSTEIKLTC